MHMEVGSRQYCDECQQPAWAVRHTQFAGRHYLCRYHYWQETGRMQIPSWSDQAASEDFWIPIPRMGWRERAWFFTQNTWRNWETSITTFALGSFSMITASFFTAHNITIAGLLGGYAIGCVGGKLLWDWRHHGE